MTILKGNYVQRTCNTRDKKLGWDQVYYEREEIMEVKLRRADIVILAEAHNPSIIAPEWLKVHSLITEEPKQFIHTPDFSMFESDSFLLVVDHQRWQLTAKKDNMESLRSLASIGHNYVRLLPHVPYRALGLNFTWTVGSQDKEEIPKIIVNIDTTDPASIMIGHELNYGGIIYAKKDPYLLKLVIERPGKNVLTHNFNYHHELHGRSQEDILKFLDCFFTRYEDSLNTIKKLYSIKVEQE